MKTFRVLLCASVLWATTTVADAEERQTTATCTDYSALDQNQKTEVAYGYLEGVQAALDKLPFDILVPPSDPTHPLWWVLPAGLGENLFAGLAEQLDAHCRPAQNKHETILGAFLSIAHQKEGEPSLGISFDKKKTDPWKKFLGGSVSCSAYSASPQGARNAIIYGYYLGTEAVTRVTSPRRSTTGRSSNLIAWPSKSTPQGVRVEVDKACQRGNNKATLRDVLWVTTVELVAKEGGPPQPGLNRK
jgi:hypothetical protein